MTYCNLDTEEIRRFQEVYTRAELKKWFEELVSEYEKWARYQMEWRAKRNASIKTVEFPFEYRDGQKKLVASVYRTILRKKKLFIQAPTGVGKTMAAVFPAVKAVGEELGEKIGLALREQQEVGSVQDIVIARMIAMELVEGLTEEEKTPSESIKAAVAYFAMLLQKADTLGCDLDAVIQSYNYGAGYIDYISVRGKAHTFQLSCDFASSKCGGRKVKYDNPVAIAQNGGWRYGYGNMFYVYLVKQYLESEPLPADTANAVLAEAYKYQGWKYVWGGSSPQTSFDCSGLTQWCFGQAGVSLPRTAQEQYEAVQHLELEEAQPGDLVFFTKTYKTDNYITHVGIYAGNGRMFHAGNPIGFADLNTNFWKEHFVCIGRVSMPST